MDNFIYIGVGILFYISLYGIYTYYHYKSICNKSVHLENFNDL